MTPLELDQVLMRWRSMFQSRLSLFHRSLNPDRLGAVIGLALLLLVFSLLSPPFRQAGNLVFLAKNTAITIGIVAVGQTVVLISGGIDLSVSSVIALAGLSSAILMKHGLGPIPPLTGNLSYLAIGIGWSMGILIGAGQGWLITKHQMPAFIVTLGTMVGLRGFALAISQGAIIYGLPSEFKWFSDGHIGIIPAPVLIMLVIYIFTAYMLRNTKIGRYCHAIGGNETAARLSGINVDRYRIYFYAYSGLLAAVKAANEKGVPILAHNFITPFSEGTVTSYIGYDQWGGAEKLGKATCELLAEKYNTTIAETPGKVFILLGIDSIFSHRRTGGFKAGLEKNCPNVEIVGEQTAEWLRTKGSEVATIALQKDPDIDVFYGNSDEMAIGAALAAEQLGKVINVDFFAVGIDGNQPTLDLLREGKFSATLGVDPFRMGVTVVETMQKVLDGQTVPEITLTPSVVVTPENLQDYLDGKLWTEPVAGFPELDNDLPTVPEEEVVAVRPSIYARCSCRHRTRS